VQVVSPLAAVVTVSVAVTEVGLTYVTEPQVSEPPSQVSGDVIVTAGVKPEPVRVTFSVVVAVFAMSEGDAEVTVAVSTEIVALPRSVPPSGFVTLAT
jgi:hypothetical protein